jgi:hypothetical protein
MQNNELKHFKQFHIHTSDQKLKWFGNGEWVEEPDLCCFKYKSISCFIRRIIAHEVSGFPFGGHLCGYCYVPNDHIYFQLHKKMYEIDIDCHYGITYSEVHNKNGKHIIGFDTIHLGDLMPSRINFNLNLLKIQKLLFPSGISDVLKHNSYYVDDIYRNISYVIENIKSMVDSLMEANTTNG